MRFFFALVKRDLSIAFRAGGGAINGVVFYFLGILIFSLTIGPNPALLSSMAPAIVWVMILFSATISLDRLFRDDIEDGSMDALLETATPLAMLPLAKATAHWLSTLLPLILLTPLAAVLLSLPPSSLGALLASVLVGTPALSLYGCLGAAITSSMSRATVLLALLTLPLLTPTLIFGVAVASATSLTDPALPSQLLFLGAATFFAGAICPLAAAAVLRLNS